MLRIVGDVNLTDGYFDVGYGIGTSLRLKQNPFKNIAINPDEKWIGNFEGVASEYTINNGLAANQFRVSPEYLTHFKHMDYYGVANNHVMQHGDTAYNDTIKVLNQLGATTFGSKINKSIVFLENGRKVSITGLCQRLDQFSQKPLYWHNPNIADIKDELSNIPCDAFKIAYLHWGYEFINYPSQMQKIFAHELIDMGFDLIIGMHPHVLQGFEQYKSKYIFYSLGNFSFNMPWEPTKYGLIVNVHLEGALHRVDYNYIYINDDYTPIIIEEKDVPDDFRLNYLNTLVKKNVNGEQYFHEVDKCNGTYQKANRWELLSQIISHPVNGKNILLDFFKRHF